MRCGGWLVASLCAGLMQAADSVELPDQKAKVSYGIGMNLGTQWRQQEVPIDPDLLMKGMRDAMEGKETLMTEEEMRNVLMTFQNQHRAQQTEKRRIQGPPRARPRLRLRLRLRQSSRRRQRSNRHRPIHP